MSFVSVKIELEETAKHDAEKYSKEQQTLYTVIKCYKSNGYFVVQGDGDMIRNFEEIVIMYDKGKVYNP